MITKPIYQRRAAKTLRILLPNSTTAYLCQIPTMISVKEAAKIASVGGLAWKTSVRLEELEAGDLNGNKVWFITLSIPAPDAEFLDLTRQHKVFAVHAQSGEVMSMKIREFSGVHD